MGRVTKCLIVAFLLASSAISAGATEDINNLLSLENALRNGRLTLELRPRYNRIDESTKPLLTEGGTVRAIVGWRTAPFHGWRATLEGIHTDYIGRKRFNEDGAQNATSPYPLLPDPRHSGLNQVHAEGDIAGLRLKLGRQLLRMDNQRWLSDNDFRQIPQLFDGASAAFTPTENTELMAGHFRRMRNTSGLTLELKLSVLHAAWNPLPGQSVAAYGFFHDQAQNGAFTGYADNSYQVAGIRAEGALAGIGSVEIPYLAEFARQRPYAGGDSRIDANYWRLGAGLASNSWTVRYDYEVKSSNGGRYGLQAPLTDFYAFNGWALHFFNTPREGLRDRWATLRHAIGPVILYAEAHRFRSDFGGLDFGRESDLGVTWQAHPDASLRLQHARYDPGSGGTGAKVRKTWLTLTYTY